MIGIDVVDIPRLERALARQTGLAERLFTTEELAYCSSRKEAVRHLAGTLAAKEAVVKCLGLPSLVASARRIEVRRDPDGAPGLRLDGRPHPATLSISHDGPYALAVALDVGSEVKRDCRSSCGILRPNADLVRYLSPPGYKPVSDATEPTLVYLGSDFP